MTNITTLDFKKKEKPVTVQEEVKEQPKFARMTFDQVTDMKSEELLIPISIMKLLELHLVKFPGLKYIKQHIPMHLMNGIKI